MAALDNSKVVVIPSCINEGVYMFTVDLSKHVGIFQLTEVEYNSEGGLTYYELQVSHNPRSRATFKSFKIRSTDTNSEEATHGTPLCL